MLYHALTYPIHDRIMTILNLPSELYRRALVVALLAAAASLHSTEAAESIASVNVVAQNHWPEDRPIVGAYYYPWYVGEESEWQQTLRQQLDPPQSPRAGLYRSDDPQVIKEHIAQSLRAGISFWSVSWWGPQSLTDRNFRHAILDHPDAASLRFAVHYESTGRFGDPNHPNLKNWEEDLKYLEEHYFSHPNYLRINDRPVLFVYLSRVFLRDQGAAIVQAARARPSGIFIVGDDVFGPEYRAEWAQKFDAVTAYDVYGQSSGVHGSTRQAMNQLATNYREARQAANQVGTAFIPAVSPGFNDTVIRNGHPVMPRRFKDQGEGADGDVFRDMIAIAAIPNLDPRCGRLMMVTSFNEWYEDSQIEATVGNQPSTAYDLSSSKSKFTAEAQYEDYGNRYLEILAQSFAPAPQTNR
jgi:glycoprotein endo-alpha-1,2-mannosidase